MYCLTLSGITKEYGEKAYKIGVLYRYEFEGASYRIPPGFLVTHKVYEIWRKERKIPKEIVKEIEKYFKSEIKRFPVIVRSAANVENGKYAGIFKSVPNVKTLEGIIDAIIEVFKSGEKENVLMNVLIQKQIDCEFSGVSMITEKDFVTEYVIGNNFGITSGRISPIRTKSKEGFLKKVYEACLEAFKIFGEPLDIEWGYKDDTVYIFQARRIKVPEFKKEKVEAKEFKYVLKGIPISPGVYRGKVQFITDASPPEEAEKIFKPGNVLMTWILYVDYIPVLKKAGAIIIKDDCLLSHAAIIARELGIPCVGGVDIEKIPEDEEVIVDGNEGKVYLKRILDIRKRSLYRESREYKSREAKEIERKFIEALENLDYKKLEEVCEYAYLRVIDLWKKGKKDLAWEIYHKINELLQIKSIEILKRKYPNILDVLRDVPDEKLRKVYEVLKKFINYEPEYAKEMYYLLFGIRLQ